MKSFKRAPSRRNARLSNAALDGGVVIRLESFTVGGGFTTATVLAMSSGAAVVASTDAAQMGAWILTGYSGSDVEVAGPSSISAGLPDPDGVLFAVVFPFELDELQPWSLAAPKLQTCIRGAGGGTISGIIYTGEPITSENSGIIPLLPNGGQPVLPGLVVFVSVALYSSDILEVQFVTTSGSQPDFEIFGNPAWLINGGNSVIDTTSPGAGVLRVQFADPISGGQTLLVPAWDARVRSTAGQWIPPLQVTL